MQNICNCYQIFPGISTISWNFLFFGNWQEIDRDFQIPFILMDGRRLSVHCRHLDLNTSAERNGNRASTTAATDFRDLYYLPVLMVEEQGIDTERERCKSGTQSWGRQTGLAWRCSRSQSGIHPTSSTTTPTAIRLALYCFISFAFDMKFSLCARSWFIPNGYLEVCVHCTRYSCRQRRSQLECWWRFCNWHFLYHAVPRPQLHSSSSLSILWQPLYLTPATRDVGEDTSYSSIGKRECAGHTFTIHLPRLQPRHRLSAWSSGRLRSRCQIRPRMRHLCIA